MSRNSGFRKGGSHESYIPNADQASTGIRHKVVAMIDVFIDTFVVLTQTAFGTVFGTSFGNIFVAICLFFFAFSTVLSWNMFGKINVIYMFGQKAVKFYQIIALVFILLGTLASNDLVWELSDMFNQLMVIPNAIALLILTGMVTAGAKIGKKAA